MIIRGLFISGVQYLTRLGHQVPKSTNSYVSSLLNDAVKARSILHTVRVMAPSASSCQPIQIRIRPHQLDFAQRMAVRQVAHHLHGLGLRLLTGKALQGSVGFGV